MEKFHKHIKFINFVNMKKMKVAFASIIIMYFTISISNLQAQSYIGLTAGPEWVKYLTHQNSNAISRPKLGYSIRLDYNYLIEDRSIVGFGIKYSRVNQYIESSNSDSRNFIFIKADCKINNFAFDVFAQIDISKNNHLQVIIGSSTTTMISAIALNNNNTGKDVDIEYEDAVIPRFSELIFTGLNWDKQISNKFRIEIAARYFYDIMNIGDIYNPNGVILSFGILCKLGK